MLGSGIVRAISLGFAREGAGVAALVHLYFGSMRGQTSSADRAETFCDLMLRWKSAGWAEESGQIPASMGPFLEQRMRERGARVVRAIP